MPRFFAATSGPRVAQQTTLRLWDEDALLPPNGHQLATVPPSPQGKPSAVRTHPNSPEPQETFPDLPVAVRSPREVAARSSSVRSPSAGKCTIRSSTSVGPRSTQLPSSGFCIQMTVGSSGTNLSLASPPASVTAAHHQASPMRVLEPSSADNQLQVLSPTRAFRSSRHIMARSERLAETSGGVLATLAKAPPIQPPKSSYRPS